MESETIDPKQILEAVESLRREVTRLSERMTAFEKVSPNKETVSVPRTAEPPAALGCSEELIAVISAAIAAFLGVKPRIRQIRLLGSAPWGQQGRVTIQASHALSVHHG